MSGYSSERSAVEFSCAATVHEIFDILMKIFEFNKRYCFANDSKIGTFQ